MSQELGPINFSELGSVKEFAVENGFEGVTSEAINEYTVALAGLHKQDRESRLGIVTEAQTPPQLDKSSI